MDDENCCLFCVERSITDKTNADTETEYDHRSLLEMDGYAMYEIV